jgi:hypothetical protein
MFFTSTTKTESSRRRRHRIDGGLRRGVMASVLALSAILLAGFIPLQHAQARTVHRAEFSVSRTGVNYYDPTSYFTHCADFTYLTQSCWNNQSIADPPRQQLLSDLKFVTSQHIGSLQRVWISLDQLMLWNPQSGFDGWRPGALHRVDDMLAIYRQFHVQVILVLFVYDGVSGWKNQFHPEAVDGQHAAMRAGYLRAEKQFLRHISQNPTDVAAMPVVELATEVYYQLEMFFDNPDRLGAFQNCRSGSRTNWDCVDRTIIHPWLKDLYRTARSASTAFLYTFADTGRLFHDYAYWNSMYPQDVIDEHLYDNAPWDHAKLYANGREFTKQWLATEVGCSSGNVYCTYSGTRSTAVDSWWLDNLPKDGAKSVLVECHVTAWLYPNGSSSQVLTATGRKIQSVVSNSRRRLP